jgi:hypothetical protein
MRRRARPGYDPADRYRAGGRPVLLTGVQAVARMLVEQNVRDARAGLRTEALGLRLPRQPARRPGQAAARPAPAQDRVRRAPGPGHERGARRHRRVGQPAGPGTRTNDGVLGVWYGKGPGLDRSGDVLRHGNLYGAHPEGGVLVLCGDDPAAKSSSVPCASTRTMASFGMPVLMPRNATELISFGLYGTALSRLTGCWVGMSIVADVADGLWTVDEDFASLPVVVPALEWEGRPWTYTQRVFASRRTASSPRPTWSARAGPASGLRCRQPDRRHRGRPGCGVARHRRRGRRTTRCARRCSTSDSTTRRCCARDPPAARRHAVPARRGPRPAPFRPLGLGEPCLVVVRRSVPRAARIKDVPLGTAGTPQVLGQARRLGTSLGARPTATGPADRLDSVPALGAARPSSCCASRARPPHQLAALPWAHGVLLQRLPAQPLDRRCPRARWPAAASAATRW